MLGTGASLGLLLACSELGNQDTGSRSKEDAAAVERDASGSGMGGSDAGSSTTNDSGPCGREERNAAPVESLFEPAWLPNVPLDSVAGVLTLFASTLRDGPNGLELYAGICNDGEFPLCSAGIQVEFYDHSDQLIGTTSGGVQSGRLFSFSQSPTPITCVAPGQTAMAAMTTLPMGLLLDDLKFLGHRFPAFQIEDAVLVPGVTVTDVQAFEAADGAVFRGTVTNASDIPITNPAVSVFPVNDVGRPLGVAVSTATLEIPPGGTWSFETSVVAERGVSHLAFASGSLLTSP